MQPLALKTIGYLAKQSRCTELQATHSNKPRKSKTVLDGNKCYEQGRWGP